MAKKKDEKSDGEQPEYKKQVVKPKVRKVKVQPPKQYYEPRMWKGIKEVYRCLECDHFEDEKDNMIQHVVKHVPGAEKMALLEKLLRSK